jgi:amino acid transporter
MTEKIPTSFKIFILVITITGLAFLTATLFSYYQVDKKYSMILAFFMFVALAFTTVGIYAGFKHKTDERKPKTQNKIGCIGNLLIFLFTITLMAYAALTNAN